MTHRASYDVIIVGGGIMGASTAWWLTELGFDGSISVIERDPTYAFAATSLTNSCMRQQFSTALNVRISQFAAEFVKNLRAYMGGDARVPDLAIRNFGYLYLADSSQAAAALQASREVQIAAGAGTEYLEPGEIARRFPFYDLTGIVGGTINTRDEGYFDGGAVFDWWRRQSRERGVHYLTDEVVGMNRSGSSVAAVQLASGDKVACGQLVNATGTRGAQTAAMAGLPLPVEPRKRHTWVFAAERPLDRPLPLTIDPSGFHVRDNGGGTYMAGGHGPEDPAVEVDDFAFDGELWLDFIWPRLARRIPAFEAVRVQSEWVGHYDFNTLDQNAVIGPHPEVRNFHFLNGFSGHGLQQAPAMGRGMAELLTHGAFRTLDLSPFGYERIASGTPLRERAVI